MSGKNIVLQLENCNDREVAKDYQFTEIAVKREDLPNLPENEYYWTDLYGLNVYTVFGSVDEPKLLGVVDHMLETGANDVVVINCADNLKKKHLVPYVLDKYVISIDLQQGKMVVDWDPEF